MELKNYPSGDVEFDKWFREVNPEWADQIDEQLKTKTLLNRFAEAYDFLVSETENPLTLHDRTKNQRLKDLLELFEYLRGEDEANPLNYWFSE